MVTDFPEKYHSASPDELPWLCMVNSPETLIMS